ncbi:hypothetical protein HYALB_00000756 [Hymenoscyphus albidus]|uniref:Uncharacterized protein n=1 Tax=Hymenoscyphus albidus TaxID=595503 RepID=A0A9N9LTD5_9HELO|nr:hypothetical protein HYALB_00000756 [Hymenoscyphus albidus]
MSENIDTYRTLRDKIIKRPIPHSYTKTGRPDSILPTKPLCNEKSKQMARQATGEKNHRETRKVRRENKLAHRKHAKDPLAAPTTTTAEPEEKEEKEKKKRGNGRARKRIPSKAQMGADEREEVDMNVGREEFEVGGEDFAGWKDEVVLRLKEN